MRQIQLSNDIVFVAAVLGLAVTFCLSSPVRACSPISCWPGTLIPTNGSVIPAGTFNLPFDVAQVPDLPEQTVESMAVEISTTGGDTVPYEVVTNGNQTFLKVTLAPDTSYKVRWQEPCYGLDLPLPEPVEHVFSTGAELPIPDISGLLTVGPVQWGTGQVPTSSGSCTTEVPAAVVPITMKLPSDVLPFLPLLGIISNEDAATAPAWLDFGTLPPADADGNVLVFQPWTQCGYPDPPDPGAQDWNGSGIRTDRNLFWIGLPGQTPVLVDPGEVEYSVGCELLPSNSETSDEASPGEDLIHNPGDVTQPFDLHEVLPDETLPDNAVNESPGGSCSMGNTVSPSIVMILLLMTLLPLLNRRLRQRNDLPPNSGPAIVVQINSIRSITDKSY